ncbi:MAG TPA: CrcB family protein [Thermoguttaceae bacterium]|nr:CrcB family protein [Thermoguttaceae bacterium]
MVLQKLLLIGLAGGLGSLARYGLSGFVANRFPESSFPWGTACVNLVGCLVFGILWSVMESRLSLSGEVRAMILVGFMGAFTTFSTFIYETSGLIQNSLWMLAAGNLLLQNVVGIVALFVGLAVGRLI